MIEIERKFLVDKNAWKIFKKDGKISCSEITQAYLFSNNKITARVRLKQDLETKAQSAFLTIKGASNGISRSEYEYQIPVNDALKMVTEFCAKYIKKKRYTFSYENNIWEVDEFFSPNPELILAEIELEKENQSFKKPIFCLQDVSENKAYYNVNMLK